MPIDKGSSKSPPVQAKDRQIAPERTKASDAKNTTMGDDTEAQKKIKAAEETARHLKRLVRNLFPSDDPSCYHVAKEVAETDPVVRDEVRKINAGWEKIRRSLLLENAEEARANLQRPTCSLGQWIQAVTTSRNR